eukprot:846760-Prorocentrum_minimum.AAC.1
MSSPELLTVATVRGRVSFVYEPHAHIPVPKTDFPTAESIRAQFFVPVAGEATAPALREALERRKAAEGGVEGGAEG